MDVQWLRLVRSMGARSKPSQSLLVLAFRISRHPFTPYNPYIRDITVYMKGTSANISTIEFFTKNIYILILTPKFSIGQALATTI